jgi:hypothetical protein
LRHSPFFVPDCARAPILTQKGPTQSRPTQSRHNTSTKREDFSIAVLLCGLLRIVVRQIRIARILFRFSAADKEIWKEATISTED